jgi:hypothetical protein
MKSINALLMMTGLIVQMVTGCGKKEEKKAPVSKEVVEKTEDESAENGNENKGDEDVGSAKTSTVNVPEPDSNLGTGNDPDSNANASSTKEAYVALDTRIDTEFLVSHNCTQYYFKGVPEQVDRNVAVVKRAPVSQAGMVMSTPERCPAGGRVQSEVSTGDESNIFTRVITYSY